MAMSQEVLDDPLVPGQYLAATRFPLFLVRLDVLDDLPQVQLTRYGLLSKAFDLVPRVDHVLDHAHSTVVVLILVTKEAAKKAVQLVSNILQVGRLQLFYRDFSVGVRLTSHHITRSI